MSTEDLRELSALSGTGFSDDDNDWVVLNCFHDLLFELKDREIRHIAEETLTEANQVQESDKTKLKLLLVLRPEP